MRDDLDFLSQDIVKLEKEYGESSLTVEEVLKIPIFSRCKVIAGHEGLGGLCKHMTPLETPDGIEWLQGGEFLISAGYALRGSDHLLNKFVFKAYKRGVAAIAIKEKRYIQKITPEMIDQANKYKIPLIILPYDFIYTETVSKFYEALFYKKNQYILQAKNMHERLLNLVFDAKDVKGVIEVLSSLTNSSIVVYDSLFNLLGSSVYNSAHKDIMKNFIEQYGLPAYGINLENYLLEMKGGSHFISSYQIASSRKVEGYVYIISDNALNNLTKNAINHGCMILSLKLKTEEKKYVNEIKIKKAVTDILMDNKNIHEEFFCNIMNDFNWNDRKSFMGISININCNKGKEKIESSIMGFKDELYSLISRFFGEEGFLITDKDDKVYVFYSVNRINDCEILINKVLSLYNNYKEAIQIHFGVSRVYSSIKDIPNMYNDCYVASLFSRENEVKYYDSLDIIKLLYPLKENRHSIEYYNRTIKRLEEYDMKTKSNLIGTLDCYFKCNMNKKDTARKLFIHIETLRYRLKRIEALTGHSLSNSEGIFILQMYLKLHQILK